MAWRRRYRTCLVLCLLAVGLLGCAGEEDDVGVSKKTTKAGSSPAPADGSVDDGGNGNGSGTYTEATPTPSPTPIADGFEVNSDYSTGSVPIVRPQSIAINPFSNDDVYVVSAPTDSRDLSKPYLLTVMTRFGTLKASASIAVLPKTLAFYGTQVFYTDGKTLTTLEANLAVSSAVEYFTGSESSKSVAMSVSFPGKPLVKAIAIPAQVVRYPGSGAPDPREFPGTAICLAFEPYKALWAAGGQTLMKIPELAANTPIETAVTDLGQLTSLAVQSNGDVWLLGTSKVALYDSAGDRKAGPFEYGGDRVFVRSNNNPVVVNYTTGTITWLKANGTRDTTGSGGLSQATLPGGLNGAAMEANGDLWVSSKAKDIVAHTRF